MPIKAIIFDLWETLATKNVGISKSLKQRFDIPDSPDFLVKYEKSVQLAPWKSETEMASSFLRSFSIDDNPENNQFVRELFQRGIDQATLYDGAHELLHSLRDAGLKIGLLSNTTVFEAEVLDRLGIREMFHATVFSWETGTLKPSKEAFETILGKLHLSPSECLFVDDGAKNTDAAREIGLNAIKFTGIDALRQSLKDYGLQA